MSCSAANKPVQRRLRGAPLLLMAFSLLANPGAARAQSGAEANRWAAWCRQQGGAVQITSSNPICIPPNGGGGNYNAQEQTMLSLAGQLGNLIGASIRQSIENSARQSRIIEMQRAWEEQQAREQAAQELERQRQRNEALLASMHGTIGSLGLSQAQLGTETLLLRGTDEMFNTPSNPRGAVTQQVPIAGFVDLQQMQIAQRAYFDALDDVRDAEGDLREMQTQLETIHSVQAYVATDLDRQRTFVRLAPAGSPERREAEGEVARLGALARQTAGIEAEDQASLVELQATVSGARARLAAAGYHPGGPAQIQASALGH